MKKILIIYLAVFSTLYAAEPESLGRSIITRDGKIELSAEEFRDVAQSAALIANQADLYSSGDIDLEETLVSKHTISQILAFSRDPLSLKHMVEEAPLDHVADLINQLNFLLAQSMLDQTISLVVKRAEENLGNVEQFKQSPEKVLHNFVLNDDTLERLKHEVANTTATNVHSIATHHLSASIFSAALSPSGDELALGLMEKKEQENEWPLPMMKYKKYLRIVSSKNLEEVITQFNADFSPASVSWADDKTVAFATSGRLSRGRLNDPLVRSHLISTLPLNTIAFKPGSKTIAVGGSDKNIYLYNFASQEQKTLASLESPVHSVSWDSVGKKLAVGSADGRLHVINTLSGKISSFQGPQSKLCSVSFKPDGMAIAGLFENGQAYIFSETDKKIIPSLDIRQGKGQIAWSPNGKYIAVGRADGVHELFDATSLSLIIRTRQPSKECVGLSWSGNSKLLAHVYRNGIVAISNIDTIILIHELIDYLDPACCLFMVATSWGNRQLSSAQRNYLNRCTSRLPGRLKDFLRQLYRPADEAKTRYGTRVRSD